MAGQPSIWDPSAGTTPVVRPQTYLVEQTFYATEGQTSFTISAFSYTPGSGTLRVFVNGARVTGVQETSSTTFSLPAGVSCKAGDKVFVEALLEEIGLYSQDVQLRADLANKTDPTKGAAQVGRARQVVSSISGLRGLLKTSASKYAFVLGYYAKGDGGGGEYALDLADTTSADNGGTVIVATDGGRWKLSCEGAVSICQFGADKTGVLDSTASINAAIQSCSSLYSPPGVYSVDAIAGIVVRTGLRFVGDGKNKTVFVAKSGGATLLELANYNRGSVFRRQFNVSPGTNDYVNDIYLADFSVVLTHPTSAVTSTAIQIGIDLRNITRSIVERVHVGNIAPIGGALVKAQNGAYDVQGYGIVVGSVSSSASSYAGGEVNTIRNCSVWGAYKLIAQDEGTLSPASAAHSVKVLDCDLQVGHHLLVQESQYTTGCSWRDNTLQSTTKQPGDASNSFIMRIEGYSNNAGGGYIEAGPSADYLMFLGASSKNNKVNLVNYSATNMAAITDAGTKNTLNYYANSGSIVGGVDSLGAAIELYDRAYKSAWVKFHWDGGAVVIDGTVGGLTVSRTGVGDYTITYPKPFRTDGYAVAVTLDTNASGHGGTWAVGSHSSSNIRIYTYAQNGASSTVIDPRFVWVKVAQY